MFILRNKNSLLENLSHVYEEEFLDKESLPTKHLNKATLQFLLLFSSLYKNTTVSQHLSVPSNKGQKDKV